jgi:phosphoribosylglycinamide formyltransferase-1
LTIASAKAAILISGGGSNLQSIIDASLGGQINVDIAVVVSNVVDAGGLARAESAGIATECIVNGDFADRESFDRALIDVLDSYNPDIVILAGFMRILSPVFVNRFAGRLLNIHPSLLPAYPGLHTHQRVIDAGESFHGCTVHFVTEELDGGPSIIQGRVSVDADDTAETLAARVLVVEHKIYPIAADLLARGRVRFDGTESTLDGKPMVGPVAYREDD